MPDGKGAASAAPTLTELADGIRADLAGIKDDNRAALAKAIAAGEKLNQAKTQLEHGEWLPWLKVNFTLTPRMAQQYMLLAANTKRVSHLGSVREGLAALPTKQPPRTSTSGRGANSITTEPKVIDWVAARRNEGLKAKEIVEASHERGDYPGSRPLSNGSMVGIDAVLRDRAVRAREQQQQASGSRKRQPTHSGRRLRQLHAEKRAGRTTGELWYMQKAVTETIGVLEGFDLTGFEWSEEAQDLIEMIYEDLATLTRWAADALDLTVTHMNDLGRQRKLQALRIRANDPSSTPSERETAARLAERLERTRRAKQLGEGSA